MVNDTTLTEYIASICRDFSEQPLPVEVRERAKQCLLDHFAALLYGAGSPLRDVGRGVISTFGEGSATLVACTRTSSVQGATFYHGLIATAVDIDDSHRFAGGLHGGATTIPAAVALTEGHQLSGERLLKAIAAGYEVSGRLARSLDNGLRARGWHSTGAVGPFGACAASSVALDLRSEEIVNALGIAASAAGGLFAFLHEGASVRHAHGAWASMSGLNATFLARSGMTGPRRILEGADGYISAFAGVADLSFVIARSPMSSGEFEILNVYHKLYACCGHALPSVTAALSLRASVVGRLHAISRIEARVYKASAALTNPAPLGVEQAKFSLPFLLAIALVRGDVSQRGMNVAVLEDPQVRSLAKRVHVVEDLAFTSAFPRLRSSEIVLTMTDGPRLRRYVDAPHGMPEHPVSWIELEEKFHDAADGVFGTERATQIVDAVRGVEQLASTTALTRLLRP